MKHGILTLLTVLLSTWYCGSAHAYDLAVANSDGKTIYYSYTNNKTCLKVCFLNSTNTLNGVQGAAYSGDIVIPAEVTYSSNTYPVVAIEEDAFTYCSGITSVSLPSSVKEIEKFAFFECTGLRTISLSEGLESIGNSAFYRCLALEEIHLPSTLNEVGNTAFSLCKNLTSLTVAEDNPTIDSRENCNAIIETATNTMLLGLKTSSIPSSVTAIGDHAFQNEIGRAHV